MAPEEQVGTLHGSLCHHAMYEFVCECDKCYKLWSVSGLEKHYRNARPSTIGKCMKTRQRLVITDKKHIPENNMPKIKWLLFLKNFQQR